MVLNINNSILNIGITLSIGFLIFLTFKLEIVIVNIKLFFSWVRKVLCKEKTMVILPANSQFNELAYFWHMGKQGENAAMDISATFQVTNTKNTDLLITGAKLRKPLGYGQASVKGNRILPGETSIVSVHFWIIPPTLKIGAPLLSDVALIDQHGNKCWIKKIKFRNTQRQA